MFDTNVSSGLVHSLSQFQCLSVCVSINTLVNSSEPKRLQSSQVLKLQSSIYKSFIFNEFSFIFINTYFNGPALQHKYRYYKQRRTPVQTPTRPNHGSPLPKKAWNGFPVSRASENLILLL